MSDKLKFCEILRSYRLAKDLTQVQAAGIIGCPIGTYRDWEQGRRTPALWIQENVIARLNSYKKTTK